MEREDLRQKAETFFENVWQRGDPWEFETSEFEQTKYARQLALLGPPLHRVLELGCGAEPLHASSLAMQIRWSRSTSPTAIAVPAQEISPAAVDFRWRTSWITISVPRVHGTSSCSVIRSVILAGSIPFSRLVGLPPDLRRHMTAAISCWPTPSVSLTRAMIFFTSPGSSAPISRSFSIGYRLRLRRSSMAPSTPPSTR